VIRRQAEALQEAARRIVGTQDAERQRVAQDLHDGIQQQLVVLRMQVGAARSQLAADPDGVDEVTEELGSSIDAILDQLRSTGQALFPSILRDRGLGGACSAWPAAPRSPSTSCSTPIRSRGSTRRSRPTPTSSSARR
jgi:signal transduction histidine kinase